MSIEIDKSNINFNRISFVANIIEKDDYRDHMKYIKCEQNFIVANDGKRLHEAKLQILRHFNIPNGYYEVIKKMKTKISIIKRKELNECDYPLYKDLFEFKGERIEYIYDEEVPIHQATSKLFAEIIRKMSKDTINYEYLKDVIELNKFNIDVYVTDDRIRFEGIDIKAVIMGLRIERKE